MQRSVDRIITTHVGSLPRPDDLIAMYRARLNDDPSFDQQALNERLTTAVAEVVRQQTDLGLDVVTDGEFGKVTWRYYIHDRLGGIAQSETEAPVPPRRSLDWESFPGYYAQYVTFDRNTHESWGRNSPRPGTLVCDGPIVYQGHEEVQRDIANLQAAMAGTSAIEAFYPALSPAREANNNYYEHIDDYLHAMADAMREEYQAVTNAGIVIQLDDPGLPGAWDTQVPPIPLEEYRKLAAKRVELLNYALRGIPEELVRYHICWGSWHGPHSNDIPLKDFADLVLQINAQGYSIEAANVRHEHEWKVWQDVKLPEGKVLIPGVVSHATNVLEHPEAVADRIIRFANVAGRENVIASTDCGMGGRVHPELAWAKLRVLVEGAELATKQLWK
jgi:5-methyltetrahydropteroyltriglutamate--homocysteine methyltransferase